MVFRIIAVVVLWSCGVLAGRDRCAAEVSIREDEYQGRPQWRIDTQTATYLLDQRGGGFSRLIDPDGRDWIAFDKDPLQQFPASAAAGYRGCPNLLFGDEPDAGGGHPGFDRCRSTRRGESAIDVQTISGRWAWTWEFTDTDATLTVTRAPERSKYWFLYEGPVAGRWSPATHYFATDRGGVRTDTPDNDHQLFGRWSWVYFGDRRSDQVLVAAHLTPDDAPDTLWYLGSEVAGLNSNDGMVVFGFGRGPGTSPELQGSGQRFRIALLDQPAGNDQYDRIEAHVRSWQAAPPQTAADAPDDQADAAAVSVSDQTLFGDMECFRIETPTATYLYGKRGAGFASVIDANGNDWVSYRHGGKAAGEYRGMPKCGQPTKYFHCGYGFGQYETANYFVSTVTAQSPQHVRIHSETTSGDSACDWDFYPTHATMTLTKIGTPAYWFLYEGTPGGSLEVERDFVVRPGDIRAPLSQPWDGDHPWVYFGDAATDTSLFLIDHQSDPGTESYVYWPYEKEDDGGYQQMTVFGFGRPDWQDPQQHTPPLTKLPAKFSIGVMPTTTYETVADRIEDVLLSENSETDGKDPEAWFGPQPATGRPWPEDMPHWFQRTWFQMGEGHLNRKTNGRFRVNDPYVATHPEFHSRQEPRASGMMQIPLLQAPRDIAAARLSLELWGGHPHSTGRRVTVNGRTTYPIDVLDVTQCNHAYPQIQLNLTDLVHGDNSIQFNVDGDQTFWGHFIVEEAAIDVLLDADSNVLTSLSAAVTHPPRLHVDATKPDRVLIRCDVDDPSLAGRIEAVHFYAHYDGFDENGDGNDNDWHGMTKRKTPIGHLGSDRSAPFETIWDTSMVVAQEGVRVRAVIDWVVEGQTESTEDRYWRSQSLCYQTAASQPFAIHHPAGVEIVRVAASEMSVPFWSRAKRPKSCRLVAPAAAPAGTLSRAQLQIVLWDGGAGNVKDYFRLNDHPLAVAGEGNHDVIHTVMEIDPSWVRPDNRCVLISDTVHHGIEVLQPGPNLTLRYTSP